MCGFFFRNGDSIYISSNVYLLISVHEVARGAYASGITGKTHYANEIRQAHLPNYIGHAPFLESRISYQKSDERRTRGTDKQPMISKVCKTRL